jgi:hypothetical protein
LMVGPRQRESIRIPQKQRQLKIVLAKPNSIRSLDSLYGLTTN